LTERLNLNKVLIVDSPLNLVSFPFKKSTNDIFILIDYAEENWVAFYKELILNLFDNKQNIKVVYYNKENFFNGNKKFLQIRRILQQLTFIDILKFILSELYLNWFTNPLGNWFKYKIRSYNLYHSYTDFEAMEDLLSKSKFFGQYAKLCSLLNIKKVMYSLSPIKINSDINNVIRVELVKDRTGLELKYRDKVTKTLGGYKNLLYLFIHEEALSYKQITKISGSQKQWVLDLNCELIIEISKIIGKKNVKIIVKEHFRSFGLINEKDKSYLRNKLESNGIILIFLNDLFSIFELFSPLELTYKCLSLTWIAGELSTFMLDDSIREIKKIILFDSIAQYRSESYINKTEKVLKYMNREELIIV
jgi:hypothetical protein